MRRIRLSLLAIGAAILLAPISSRAQTPDYQGIPDGFDYPADKAALEQLRKDQNLPALRKHSWMLFAGMTQMKPDGTPFWETWYRADEAFRPAGPTPQGPRRLVLRFTRPNQLKQTGPTPQAPGESIMSFVMFNWETYNHIRTKRLFLSSTLDGINATFPETTSWDQRKIPDFPPRAMSIKTLWWPAASNAKTPLPVWDDEPTQPLDRSNAYPTWKRVVAVDGTRQVVPDGETVSIRFNNKTFPSAHVVGLNRFYSVRVDAALVQSIAANPDTGIRVDIQRALGRDLRAGDYMLFLGFHVTSKEIPDWTWETFWWHDKPNDGKYAADRPDAVKGVWRNYLMANADDAVTPREADGSEHIGFNPWLEAGFQNGTLSNCMACHNRASYPGTVNFLPIIRGLPKPATDPAFTPGRLQTDFMWSIIDRAQ